MINLATFKKRSEFIEAYEELEKDRDYWREFTHDLEVKLQEYEGVKPTNEEAEDEFQKKVWIPYEKHGNLKTTRKRWFSLSRKKQLLWIAYIPGYVKATVIGGYPARKHCEVGISKEAWNDRLPASTNGHGVPSVRPKGVSTEEEEKVLAKAKELRNANRGRNIMDRLDLK